MKLLTIKNARVIAVGIFATLMITFSIIGGVQHYSPIPFWDMWGTPEFYAKVQAGNYAAWWQQHNEHRIVLARVLFWLDYNFFSGLSFFLIVVNYLLVALASAIFWCFLRYSKKDYSEHYTEIALGLFITGCLFSWIQEDNLTWGFQGQFFLAQTLPLWALFWLAKSTEIESGKIPFFIACLLGVLSTGTMANGVLILPLMMLYSILLRQGIKRVLLLLMLSGITIALYFYDYTSPVGHANPITSITKFLPDTIMYTFAYIGSPFFFLVGKGFIGQVAGILAGLILAVGFIWHLIRFFLYRKTSPTKIALLFFIFYICVTAFTTASGRIIFGLFSASTSRYTTPALMAWLAFFILLYSGFNFTIKKKKIFFFTMTIFCMLMLAFQLKAIKSYVDTLSVRDVAALALTLDIDDKEYIENVFPISQYALNIARTAVQKNYSIFGSYPYSGLKQEISQSYKEPLPINGCLGHLDSIEQIEGVHDYVRVSGWLFNNMEKTSSELVRFIDQNSSAAGFALTGTRRADVAEIINKKALLSGFRGYLKTTSTGQITVIGDRSDCYFRVNTLPATRIVP